MYTAERENESAVLHSQKSYELNQPARKDVRPDVIVE